MNFPQNTTKRFLLPAIALAVVVYGATFLFSRPRFFDAVDATITTLEPGRFTSRSGEGYVKVKYEYVRSGRRYGGMWIQYSFSGRTPEQLNVKQKEWMMRMLPESTVTVQVFRPYPTLNWYGKSSDGFFPTFLLYGTAAWIFVCFGLLTSVYFIAKFKKESRK
jgi:hypothetical protein